MRKIKILLLLVLILLNQPRIEAQVVSENLMRAEAMILSGNPEAAIVLLNKAVLSTKDYRFFLLRAEAFIAKGDLSGAISDFNDSNSLDSLSGEYGLARVYALKGDAQTSLYHLEKNLNSDKKRSEKEIMLDASFKRIENNPDWRAFWKKNRYTESEGKVSEIEFYTSSGKIEEATILLNEIKSDYPVSDEALYSEALVYVANK
ncbi:MAG TPA: hypothetical protein VHO50_01690, partial [Bacteroidales bacterium]|nr:hypothetical protein [Bacteroidales bacterium]